MSPIIPHISTIPSTTSATHPPQNAPTDPPTTTAPTHKTDTSMPNAQPEDPSLPPKKRKRITQPHILHQSTHRKPPWSYLHIQLITPGTASLPPATTTTTTTSLPSTSPSLSPQEDISPLLVSTLLTKPLTHYLGTTGAAIPIDILKTQGREVWLRIPRQDTRALRASLSGWIGSVEGSDVPGGQGQGGKVRVAWRVVGESGVLGLVGGGGDGRELFG